MLKGDPRRADAYLFDHIVQAHVLQMSGRDTGHHQSGQQLDVMGFEGVRLQVVLGRVAACSLGTGWDDGAREGFHLVDHFLGLVGLSFAQPEDVVGEQVACDLQRNTLMLDGAKHASAVCMLHMQACCKWPAGHLTCIACREEVHLLCTSCLLLLPASSKYTDSRRNTMFRTHEQD